MESRLESWLAHFKKLGSLHVSSFSSSDTDRCVYNVPTECVRASVVCSNKCLKGRRDSFLLDLEQLRLLLKNLGIRHTRFKVQLGTIGLTGYFNKMTGADFVKQWKGERSAADGVFFHRTRRNGTEQWKDEMSVVFSASSRSSRKLPFELRLHPSVLSRNDFGKASSSHGFVLRAILDVSEEQWNKKLKEHDAKGVVPCFVSSTFKICGRRAHVDIKRKTRDEREEKRRKRRRVS